MSWFPDKDHYDARQVNNMSSTSTTSSFSTSTVSSAPAATSSQGGAPDVSSPGTFYKNLFYILIGLLCAFGLISFLSLLRARHRRNQIVREAARLGVLVPGVPGYVPMRERQHMTWARADGTENPDWWEVEGKKDVREEEVAHARTAPTLMDDEEFLPLAIIPPKASSTEEEPIPRSELPFFPNHLAYRPSSLLPPPARFTSDQPEQLSELTGDHVDIVTVIRMPGQPWPAEMEIDESQEVVHEWGGVELGIASMEVQAPRNGR